AFRRFDDCHLSRAAADDALRDRALVADDQAIEVGFVAAENRVLLGFAVLAGQLYLCAEAGFARVNLFRRDDANALELFHDFLGLLFEAALSLAGGIELSV